MKLKKAETKIKQKAVKEYEDFKEATKILQNQRMNAKNGHHLLKRHYVALLKDVGGFESVDKKKKVELKTLFWAEPDIFHKYMDHGPPSSESSDDRDDEDVDGDDDDDSGDGDDDVDDHNNGGDDGGGDDDADNGNDGDNDDDNDSQDSNEWIPSDDEESSEALSDRYYRYQVDDEVDAYWGGDETTTAGWEFGVIAGIDAGTDCNDDEYSIIFDFNGEQVSRE